MFQYLRFLAVYVKKDLKKVAKYEKKTLKKMKSLTQNMKAFVGMLHVNKL